MNGPSVCLRHGRRDLRESTYRLVISSHRPELHGGRCDTWANFADGGKGTKIIAGHGTKNAGLSGVQTSRKRLRGDRQHVSPPEENEELGQHGTRNHENERCYHGSSLPGIVPKATSCSNGAMVLPKLGLRAAGYGQFVNRKLLIIMCLVYRRGGNGEAADLGDRVLRVSFRNNVFCGSPILGIG